MTKTSGRKIDAERWQTEQKAKIPERGTSFEPPPLAVKLRDRIERMILEPRSR